MSNIVVAPKKDIISPQKAVAAFDELKENLRIINCGLKEVDFGPLRQHGQETYFLLLRRLVVRDDVVDGDVYYNGFLYNRLDNKAQDLINPIKSSFALMHRKDWSIIEKICKTFDEVGLLEQLLRFSPYVAVSNDIRLIQTYELLKSAINDPSAFTPTLDRLVYCRIANAFTILAYVPTFFGKDPNLVMQSEDADAVSGVAERVQDAAIFASASSHQESQEEGVTHLVFHRDNRIFYFHHDTGALFNSDGARNVAFKAVTFNNTLNGILEGVASIIGSRGRDVADTLLPSELAAVLRRAGRGPGLAFGLSLRQDIIQDFMHLTMRQKIQQWFNFDRDAGFGLFVFDESFTEGFTPKMFLKAHGLSPASRSEGCSDQVEIGRIYLKYNFLTAPSSVDHKFDSHLIVEFIAGYMEGVLTAMLRPNTDDSEDVRYLQGLFDADGFCLSVQIKEHQENKDTYGFDVGKARQLGENTLFSVFPQRLSEDVLMSII